MTLFAGGPGNKRDRARLAALSDTDRQWCSERATRWYDGTHTVAWCWAKALDEATDPEIIDAAP